MENEKMYRDVDEVESFGAEALVPTGRLRGLLEHLGITTAPRYRIKEVRHLGQLEFKAIIEIFLGSKSSVGTRGQHSEHLAATLWLTPPSKPSLNGSVTTRVSCRSPSTASNLTGRRINSRPMG
jgi:hypothetical protein